MILIVRTSVPVCALSVKKFETLFLCDVYIYISKEKNRINENVQM